MSTTDYKLLTKQQQRIHSWLKEMGLSFSDFYSDALKLVNPTCTLESKANLIAQIAKEIDGSLRFVFGLAQGGTISDIYNYKEEYLKYMNVIYEMNQWCANNSIP